MGVLANTQRFLHRVARRVEWTCRRITRRLPVRLIAWQRTVRLGQPVVEIMGIRLRVGPHMSAPILEEILRWGSYETAELTMLEAHLQPQDVVMEIGGGIGFISSYCARRIGSDRVFTYEANPALETHAYDTYSLNGVWPHLRICLLGQGEGESTFYVEESFWASSTIRTSSRAKPIIIPVRSVNEEIVRVSPTFLIVDIEGGEDDLFQVIHFHTIRKIVLELHPRIIGSAHAERVLSVLRRAGFRVEDEMRNGEEVILFLQRSPTREIAPVTQWRQQQWKRIEALAGERLARANRCRPSVW